MRNLLYIGNKLSKHGSNTTVIETLGPALSNEGFKVFYASDKKNQIIRLLDMIFKTISNSFKVDYVLIDTYSTSGFYYSLIVSQLCRFLKKKYIPILHGGNLPYRLEKSPALSKLVFNNSFINVAPSNYLLNAFTSKGYKNVVFIPNSIELKKYHFKQRDFSSPKLLWVRSFSSIYNPKMALDVIKILLINFPKAELCMVGPDKENLLEACKIYSKENLSINVKFTGKLSKEEWIKLSENYNVFINTTNFDNTPTSVIEAMALGLPIVSTNVGGIPFLLKDEANALMVNKEDSKGMALAIIELFSNNKLRDSIIINARKVVEDFDWEKVKDKWFEILK